MNKGKVLLILMIITIVILYSKTVYDLYGIDGIVLFSGLTLTAVIIMILSKNE